MNTLLTPEILEYKTYGEIREPVILKIFGIWGFDFARHKQIYQKLEELNIKQSPRPSLSGGEEQVNNSSLSAQSLPRRSESPPPPPPPRLGLFLSPSKLLKDQSQIAESTLVEPSQSSQKNSPQSSSSRRSESPPPPPPPPRKAIKLPAIEISNSTAVIFDHSKFETVFGAEREYNQESFEGRLEGIEFPIDSITNKSENLIVNLEQNKNQAREELPNTSCPSNSYPSTSCCWPIISIFKKLKKIKIA